MTSPTSRNRLAATASPYLRQHADNPVNWQPWDDKALEAARERDVPIFLSIGYSACHWCHVMEAESFADETVAERLNEDFVPIKVDREERPDVDSIYMTVCQLVSGRGGWPLSAWLTPDGRPFYVGTYFPKEPKRGMPGFLELLGNLAHSWETDREEIENRADQWTAAARDRLESTSSDSSSASSPVAEAGRGDSDDEDALLQTAASTALRGVDDQYGGWGSDGPKFPQPSRIHLLLRAADRTGRPGYLEAATRTLDAMASGGLYDHVGDGFHRYCVDRDWTVPHFEKMLYDNAELTRAYLAGYQATGAERYADVVDRTLEFVDRELTHDDGGFFSTLDAQSETPDGDREEGAFYVWTPESIDEALDGLDLSDAVDGLDSDSGLETVYESPGGSDGVEAELEEIESDTVVDLVCDRFGVRPGGNFEGQTVLNVSTSIEELAESFGLKAETVETALRVARGRLAAARSDRPRPNRDEKVLASWNGLMIAACAEAAIVLGNDQYAAMATEALEFVREHHWCHGGADAGTSAESGTAPKAEDDSTVHGTLLRRFEDGRVGIGGYLEDYAFLARGALACYEATGEHSHLGFALELAETIEAEFWDADAGTLYFTPESGDSLVTRPQELTDASTPSATGVAVETLLALEHFADDPVGDIAEAVIDTHRNRLRASPLEYTTLCLAADRLATGLTEVTVAAEAVPATWRDRVGETYLPDRVLARRPPTEADLEPWLSELGLESAPPIWAGRAETDGRPTAYVCRQRTCSPPTHDIDDALAWLLE